jgi:hypothetical protein
MLLLTVKCARQMTGKALTRVFVIDFKSGKVAYAINLLSRPAQSPTISPVFLE